MAQGQWSRLQTAQASAFKKRRRSPSVTIMVFNRLLKTRFKKPLLAAIEPEDANRKNRRQIQNQTIRYGSNCVDLCRIDRMIPNKGRLWRN